METIKALFRALRAGEQLADSATWKQRQNAASAILVLLGCIAPFLGRFGITVGAEDMAAVAGGIAAVGGLFNAYLTTATSKTVGLPARRGNPDDPRADPSNLMG